ncbi:phenylalanine--tRNA ligase subunit alpha, partial [bacterium]|nr:phenylalanine--tRNA ligase subunit alpha [bacterium]
MLTTIKTIESDLHAQLAQASSLKDVEDIRVSFLGKKGSVTQLLGQMKDLPLDEKKNVGPQLQAFRLAAEEAIEARKTALQQAIAAQELQKAQSFDVTMELSKAQQGHLHPYTQFVEEIQRIFLSMGYEIWDGPELETDFHNFGALNIRL